MHIFVNTKDIGKRVDELRERSHESKRTLAKIIRVSDSYACRLLKDRAEWNNEQVALAARHYGVSEEYLRGTSKITNMTDGTDIDY